MLTRWVIWRSSMTEPYIEQLRTQWPARLAAVHTGVQKIATSLRKQAAAEPEDVQVSVRHSLDLLERGGKRTRGVLCGIGYELFGGQDSSVVSSVAGAIEAIHAYLLIMDDIADNASVRRGAPAVHVALGDYFTARNRPHAIKLGVDMAQGAALMLYHAAQTQLLDVPAAPSRILQAIDLLNDHLGRTWAGQLADINAASHHAVPIKDILRIATYKTSYYSYILPLQLGAVVAGAPKKDLPVLADFGVPAGLAFQLRDDLIGVFGDPAVTGKPAHDIAEGKHTFLMATALRMASDADKKVLHTALGDAGLTPEDLARCQKIMVDCGAVAATEAAIEAYISQADDVLAVCPASWPQESVAFLRALSHYGAYRLS